MRNGLPPPPPPKLTSMDSPVYVNPRKFSCMLLVSGLPPAGARGGRVGLIAMDPAPDVVLLPPLADIPPPGPLYECPELEVAPPPPPPPPLPPISPAPHSNGISRRSDDVKSGSKLATLSSDSTTGLKGGVICLLASRCQSIDLKNGCSLSSAASRSAPRRCFGLRFKSCGARDQWIGVVRRAADYDAPP